MGDKVLWKGEFNYYGQCFTLYTRTCPDFYKLAFPNLCRQLAKKVGRSYQSVSNYFLDGFDRYKITKVNKKKEVIT
jgi:hypothetical protein